MGFGYFSTPGMRVRQSSPGSLRYSRPAFLYTKPGLTNRIIFQFALFPPFLASLGSFSHDLFLKIVAEIPCGFVTCGLCAESSQLEAYAQSLRPGESGLPSSQKRAGHLHGINTETINKITHQGIAIGLIIDQCHAILDTRGGSTE